VRALRQTRGAFRDIPPEPLVAGLPADPVLTAQHRHLILARQNSSDKLQSLVHVTGRFPRHRQVPPAGSSNLSPIHPVNSVTNLLGPYRGEGFQWHGVKRGDAFAFYAGDIRVEGPHPFSSSGGNLGNGRTRTAMYTDNIEQLRGTVDARQVRVRAETALASFTTPSSGGWIMFGKHPS